MKTIFTFFLFVGICRAEIITLEWDKNPEPEPLTYQVFYGRSSDKMDQVLPPTTNTTVQTPDLASGTWVFVVKDVNAQGLKSDPSDKLVVKIPISKPSGLKKAEI